MSRFTLLMVRAAPPPAVLSGSSPLHPALKRSLMDFVRFPLFSMCVSKGRNPVILMANQSLCATGIMTEWWYLWGTSGAAVNMAIWGSVSLSVTDCLRNHGQITHLSHRTKEQDCLRCLYPQTPALPPFKCCCSAMLDCFSSANALFQNPTRAFPQLPWQPS